MPMKEWREYAREIPNDEISRRDIQGRVIKDNIILDKWYEKYGEKFRAGPRCFMCPSEPCSGKDEPREQQQDINIPQVRESSTKQFESYPQKDDCHYKPMSSEELKSKLYNVEPRDKWSVDPVVHCIPEKPRDHSCKCEGTTCRCRRATSCECESPCGCGSPNPCRCEDFMPCRCEESIPCRSGTHPCKCGSSCRCGAFCSCDKPCRCDNKIFSSLRELKFPPKCDHACAKLGFECWMCQNRSPKC